MPHTIPTVVELLDAMREMGQGPDDLLDYMTAIVPDNLLVDAAKVRECWGTQQARVLRQTLKHHMVNVEALSVLRQQGQLDGSQRERYLSLLSDLRSIAGELQTAGVPIPKRVEADLREVDLA